MSLSAPSRRRPRALPCQKCVKMLLSLPPYFLSLPVCFSDTGSHSVPCFPLYRKKKQQLKTLGRNERGNLRSGKEKAWHRSAPQCPFQYLCNGLAVEWQRRRAGERGGVWRKRQQQQEEGMGLWESVCSRVYILQIGHLRRAKDSLIERSILRLKSSSFTARRVPRRERASRGAQEGALGM